MAESLVTFADLFEYDRWANRRVLEKLQAAGPLQGSRKKEGGGEAADGASGLEEAVRLYSHLLRTADVWYARIDGAGPGPTDRLWTPVDRDRLDLETARVADRWDRFLSELDEEALDREIEYENSSGTFYAHPLSGILRHVVNHGTYHRGQIARVLSEATGDPPVTDYIALVRERE